MVLFVCFLFLLLRKKIMFFSKFKQTETMKNYAASPSAQLLFSFMVWNNVVFLCLKRSFDLKFLVFIYKKIFLILNYFIFFLFLFSCSCQIVIKNFFFCLLLCNEMLCYFSLIFEDSLLIYLFSFCCNEFISKCHNHFWNYWMSATATYHIFVEKYTNTNK